MVIILVRFQYTPLLCTSNTDVLQITPLIVIFPTKSFIIAQQTILVTQQSCSGDIHIINLRDDRVDKKEVLKMTKFDMAGLVPNDESAQSIRMLSRLFSESVNQYIVDGYDRVEAVKMAQALFSAVFKPDKLGK